MRKKGVIGVLGGMGPQATLEFFRRLIALTPAARDQDHLRIVIDNNPAIPDRTAAIVHHGESPVPLLKKTARMLEDAGVDLIAIPCNSAHYYLDALRKAVSIPVLDMIGETARLLKVRCAGLLATDGILVSRLYHSACSREGIDLVEPADDDQALVMRVIYAIKAGEEAATFRDDILEVIARLRKQGAEAVILGCTELSLIPHWENCPTPVYDALDALAQAAVRNALTMAQRE